MSANSHKRTSKCAAIPSFPCALFSRGLPLLAPLFHFHVAFQDPIDTGLLTSAALFQVVDDVRIEPDGRRNLFLRLLRSANRGTKWPRFRPNFAFLFRHAFDRRSRPGPGYRSQCPWAAAETIYRRRLPCSFFFSPRLCCCGPPTTTNFWEKLPVQNGNMSVSGNAPPARSRMVPTPLR